jgi:hypothetical protein
MAGFHIVFPPLRTCSNSSCREPLRRYGRTETRCYELKEPHTFPATLFTLDAGALPVFITSLYCRCKHLIAYFTTLSADSSAVCKSRYYSDHFIHGPSRDSKIRTYYSSLPPMLLHVTRYSVVQIDLIEMWASSFVFSAASATAIARIYNLELGKRSQLPASYRTQTTLDPQIIWDSFFLHALLKEWHEKEAILEFPHSGTTQEQRFRALLKERSDSFVGFGQEAWSHACDKCFTTTKRPDGQTGKFSLTRSPLASLIASLQEKHRFLSLMELLLVIRHAKLRTARSPYPAIATTTVTPISTCQICALSKVVPTPCPLGFKPALCKNTGLWRVPILSRRRPHLCSRPVYNEQYYRDQIQRPPLKMVPKKQCLTIME